MSSEWVPIQYRDFYDVPRAIVVEWQGHRLFLDCPFDSELDDYPSHYTVYRLADDAQVELASSWIGLDSRGTAIGDVAVDRVVFDKTKRLSIHRAVLVRLVSAEDGWDGDAEK